MAGTDQSKERVISMGSIQGGTSTPKPLQDITRTRSASVIEKVDTSASPEKKPELARSKSAPDILAPKPEAVDVAESIETTPASKMASTHVKVGGLASLLGSKEDSVKTTPMTLATSMTQLKRDLNAIKYKFVSYFTKPVDISAENTSEKDRSIRLAVQHHNPTASVQDKLVSAFFRKYAEKVEATESIKFIDSMHYLGKLEAGSPEMDKELEHIFKDFVADESRHMLNIGSPTRLICTKAFEEFKSAQETQLAHPSPAHEIDVNQTRTRLIKQLQSCLVPVNRLLDKSTLKDFKESPMYQDFLALERGVKPGKSLSKFYYLDEITSKIPEDVLKQSRIKKFEEHAALYKTLKAQILEKPVPELHSREYENSISDLQEQFKAFKDRVGPSPGPLVFEADGTMADKQGVKLMAAQFSPTASAREKELSLMFRLYQHNDESSQENTHYYDLSQKLLRTDPSKPEFDILVATIKKDCFSEHDEDTGVGLYKVNFGHAAFVENQRCFTLLSAAKTAYETNPSPENLTELNKARTAVLANFTKTNHDEIIHLFRDSFTRFNKHLADPDKIPTPTTRQFFADIEAIQKQGFTTGKSSKAKTEYLAGIVKACKTPNEAKYRKLDFEKRLALYEQYKSQVL